MKKVRVLILSEKTEKSSTKKSKVSKDKAPKIKKVDIQEGDNGGLYYVSEEGNKIYVTDTKNRKKEKKKDKESKENSDKKGSAVAENPDAEMSENGEIPLEKNGENLKPLIDSSEATKQLRKDNVDVDRDTVSDAQDFSLMNEKDQTEAGKDLNKVLDELPDDVKTEIGKTVEEEEDDIHKNIKEQIDSHGEEDNGRSKAMARLACIGKNLDKIGPVLKKTGKLLAVGALMYCIFAAGGVGTGAILAGLALGTACLYALQVLNIAPML